MVNGKLRTLGVASAAALALGGASVAFASGPGNETGNGESTGRSQITLDCENGESYTVAVVNPEGARGVGQLVGEKGHLIPTGGEFTIVDETLGITLDSEPLFTDAGHKNQETVECTAIVFSGTASDFFGPDLPDGVGATDTITGSVTADVIPQI